MHAVVCSHRCGLMVLTTVQYHKMNRTVFYCYGAATSKDHRHRYALFQVYWGLAAVYSRYNHCKSCYLWGDLHRRPTELCE